MRLISWETKYPFKHYESLEQLEEAVHYLELVGLLRALWPFHELVDDLVDAAVAPISGLQLPHDAVVQLRPPVEVGPVFARPRELSVPPSLEYVRLHAHQLGQVASLELSVLQRQSVYLEQLQSVDRLSIRVLQRFRLHCLN